MDENVAKDSFVKNTGADDLDPAKIGQRSENSWLSLLALGMVVVGGMIPRLNHVTKSLWTAEAWVANSVLCDSLSHMFHYEVWLQTTPPLFLLMLRWAVEVFRPSDLVFRAVPLLLSLLSLVLLAWLSRLIFRTPFAVLCTALLALCPPAVVLSKEVKQYAGDLAATCLVLLLSWMYLKAPTVRRYVWLVSGLAVALFLSYPAVCFIPVVFLFLLVAQPLPTENRARTSAVAFRLIPAGLITATICAVNYWAFVRPNRSPLLSAYWESGYPPFGHPRALLHFYAEYFGGMAIYYYFPAPAKEMIQQFLSAGGHVPLLILAVIVVTTLWIGGPILRKKPYRDVLVMCSLPVFTLAILNALRLYPVSGRRLTLFIFPCIALMTSALLQAVWDRLLIPAKVDASGRLAGFLTISFIGVIFVVGMHADQWANYQSEDEDVAGAVQYLKSEVKPDDTVYVHASLEESLKLYFKLLKWSPAHLYFGDTGWPCCTRKSEIQLADSDLEKKHIISDFEKGKPTAEHQTSWLVFTSAEGHWTALGRDERQIITGHLIEQGCHRESERDLTNIQVMKFVCGVNASEVAVVVPFHLHRHLALDCPYAEAQIEDRETESYSRRLRTL